MIRLRGVLCWCRRGYSASGPADRCTLFSVLHTSASLALNESWDPDVRDDMEMMLNKIVPEGLPYRHSCEGPDDMVRVCCVFHDVTLVHFTDENRTETLNLDSTKYLS